MDWMQSDEKISPSNQIVDNICGSVEHVCKNIGSREAGSDGEHDAMQYMADMLTTQQDTQVELQSFDFAPSAMDGWKYITIISLLLAFVAYFFSCIVSFALLVVAAVPYILQHFCVKRVFDGLFAQKKSQNLVAIKPSATAKKRVLICASADAAYENWINYRIGSVAYIVAVSFALLGWLYLFAIVIARWAMVGGVGASIAQGTMLYVGCATATFVAPWVFVLLCRNRRKVTQGANCNLSSCFVTIAAFEKLKSMPLENVEVGVLICGAKQAGNRGAKAWCDAQSKVGDDIPTCIITLDSLRDENNIRVNKRDLRAIVECDEQLVDTVLQAAERSGKRCRTQNGNIFNVTDAAIFASRGYASVSITAVTSALPPYYQTRYDTFDNLGRQCLQDCFDIVVDTVRLLDEKA